MKVLYVKRDDFKGLLKKRNFRKLFYQYRTRDELVGQNGFFEGALYSAFDVTEVSWNKLKQASLQHYRDVDIVVVNQKSKMTETDISELTSRFRDTPKILFSCYDKVEKLAEDKILDRFDLVYKREPFKDLDRYTGITAANKIKIKPTMLACPLIKLSKNDASNYELNLPQLQSAHAYPYDFSFAGKGTSLERYRACNQVADDRTIESYLSIFDSVHNAVPGYVAPQIKNDKLPVHQYIQLIKDTAVNFAPAGIGQFTHRHLELWYLGAFMISSSSINEYMLPGGHHLENEHYVIFDDEKDLLDKIHYYLKHPEERLNIARQGQQLFENIYDFQKHGQEIKASIEAL